MAKKTFRIKDKQGNDVDYVIPASRVALDSNTDLDEKIGDIEDDIDEVDGSAVKKITFNGGTPETPDEHGNVSLNQAKADWTERDSNSPKFIEHKPDIVEDVFYEEQTRTFKKNQNGTVSEIMTLPEGSSGYEPPEGGIPKEDLHPSVQTSLGLADTALQAADKAQLQAAINAVQTALNNLMNGASVTDAIDTFNEVINFLDDIDTDDPTLSNQLLDLSNAITTLQGTLSQKANSSDVANTYATKSELASGLSGKQNTLTFDDAPTAGSNNPVKSGGIKDALDEKANAADVPTNQDMADAIDDALGEAQVTVVPAGSVGVISSLGSDSDEDALSASMGKKLRVAISTILNSLGNYAFPNGKPTIDWGFINYNINTDGVTGGLTISDVEVDGSSVQSMPSQVADGKSLSFKLNLPSGVSAHYRDVAIKIDNNDISGYSNVWNPATGLVTIAHVTGDVSIEAKCMVDIEYLQSTGEQAIQTGIVPSTNFKCEIDAQFTEVASWKRLVASFGTTASSDLDGKWSTVLGFTGDPKAYAQYGGYFAAITGTFTNRMTYISSLANNQVKLEAGGVSATAVYEGTHCISPLGLFAQWRSDNTFNSHCKAKVYYCKMWNNNVLVRHFVPVRIGQVGYMLDNVSGELFENLGTGSFVLGNDVTI